MRGYAVIILVASLVLPALSVPVTNSEVFSQDTSTLAPREAFSLSRFLRSVVKREPLIEEIPSYDLGTEEKRDGAEGDGSDDTDDNDETELDPVPDSTDLSDKRGLNAGSGPSSRGLSKGNGPSGRGLTRGNGPSGRGLTRGNGPSGRGLTKGKGPSGRGLTSGKGPSS